MTEARGRDRGSLPRESPFDGAETGLGLVSDVGVDAACRLFSNWRLF